MQCLSGSSQGEAQCRSSSNSRVSNTGTLRSSGKILLWKDTDATRLPVSQPSILGRTIFRTGRRKLDLPRSRTFAKSVALPCLV